MALVSVIIPCYNQGRFLFEAVDSVLRQTHQNWECIIVNDGSVDDTADVIQQLMQLDSRVKCVTKRNGGLGSARNAGLAEAQGTYLQFLDADDLLEASKFAKQLEDIQKKPNGTIAISDHFPFDDLTKEFAPRMYISPWLDEREFKKQIVTDWEFRRSIPCHNLLIPRKIISANNLTFDENIPNHEDWVFWCQLFYYATGICYQDEKLVKYRMRSDSMSNQRQQMAQGFLAATFVLEAFYRKLAAPDYVSAVKKIRKEIKNNLFPQSIVNNYYAAVKNMMKRYLSVRVV